ncbi:glycosyltransferase, partial [Bacillus xiapuensis]|nr:glycosyltransferase [Bacillus xiapuensis]
MAGNIAERLIYDIKNSFTYEFMIKPGNIHQVDQQSREIPVNSNGKNYIIGPARGKEQKDSGICVSVGINGVSVYEFTKNNIYATLVYEATISDWVHVAVVYKEKKPYLFINGTMVKEGEKSFKQYVYPSGSICEPPGIFFNGEIREIRIWDHSRNETQLKQYMNTRLKRKPNGLYIIWPKNKTERNNKETLSANNTEKTKSQIQVSEKENLKNQKETKKENKRQSQSSSDKKDQDLINDQEQKIKVSIIIPSYNKYPLNLFTLYSLENQTFNPNQMEVIFIDDASTDKTEEFIQNYHPPYSFKYIRNNENLGRAKVRNIGIKSSSGSILIFLDAEMLVDPDFVTNHVNYHQAKDNLIMSGVMYSKNINTCIFPEFDSKKLSEIAEMVKDNKKLYRQINNYEKTASEPFSLITKSDVMNQAYGELIKEVSYWHQNIIRHFGTDLKSFEFPWMAFLTGNVSLKRELLDKVGIFDEEFVKYGYEDWELGYRLYKGGAQYINAKDVVSYHQEHPIGENKWKDAIENYHLFIKKHSDVDVLI